jgi:ribosome-binding factor A
MVSKVRLQRISERITEELSEMLILEVKDPRLSGIFITGVKVDRELAYADIYVSAVEGSQRAEDVITAFEHASGYFRSQLATRLDLRIFPRLRFHWDPTPERAAQIEQLIAELHQESSHEVKEELSSFGFAQDRPFDSALDEPMDEEGGEDG